MITNYGKTIIEYCLGLNENCRDGQINQYKKNYNRWLKSKQ